MTRFLFTIPAVKSPVGAQFIDLAVELDELGHAVCLATQTDVASAGPARTLGEKVDVVRWPSSDGTALRDARFFSSLIASWRPDCIAAQFSFVNLALLVGWAHGVPRRIAWYHTLIEQSAADRGGRPLGWRLRLRRRRLVYRLATDVVSVSRVGVDELVNVFGVPESRCRIVPNGIVDPGLRSSSSPATQRIVCAGRLVASKGQAVLIEAFARLRVGLPEAELVLIGSGPLMSDLQRRVHELGIEDFTRFTGKVPHDEVMTELRAATVLALPSRIDNCPVIVQEAMSLGLPVVATDVGGLRELVEHERTALLVPPDDADQLMSSLQRALTDDVLRRRLTDAARRSFEEKFQRGRFVERVTDLMLGATATATAAD